jgi:pilus assembly protein FimV
MKKKLILLTLVFGLTIVSQSTFSLGMGNIQVYSSLDEPLRANIELIISPDEDIQNLSVALASSADYQRVGLDKSFVPANIAVALDPDNPSIINVTSNGPVSEPIVSLLMDVNWNNGRILREFTVLLDPPAYEVRNADVQVSNVVMDQVVEAETEDSSDNTPVLQERNEATEQPVTTYTNEDVVQNETASNDLQSRDSFADEVYVNEGDTLWSIANRNKLGGLSTNQMMIAIFNNNTSAFIDNNINKLVKGSRLVMPGLAEAEAISYSQALAEVESHNQNWTGYSAADYSSYQTTSDDEQDDDYSASSLDYGVQLSGGDSEGSDSGQTNAEAGSDDSAGLSDEDAFNQASEQAEMQERISELEDIVQQQQSVIEIQDGGLSNLENQLADANDTDSVDTTVDEGLTDDAMVDDVWGIEVEGDDGNNEGLDLQLTDVDTSATVDEDMVDTDGDVELTDSGTETAVEEPVTTEPVDQSPPKFTATPVQTESMVDKTINWVMDNLQWVLIALVGLIVLIFVPRVLRNRGGDEEETSFLDDIKARNKEADELDDAPEMADTKLNAPLPDDTETAHDEEDTLSESEAEGDEGDDVLAELDKSIMFDEQDDDAEDDISQLLDEAEDADTTADDDGGFDLDGFLDDADDEADDTEAEVDDEAEEEAAVADTLSDDDFNFDLDELDEDEDSTKTLERDLSDDQKAALGTETDDAVDVEDDFDLNLEDELAGFELDAEDAEAEVEAPVDQAADSNESDDDDEMNFDEDFDFDLDDELEDLDVDDHEEAADDAAGSIDDEFEDVLDLSDEAEDSFDIEEGEETMDEELDLGLEGLLDEGDAIDTKLDLAKAYLDMGDNEGAKNLLEEVVSEGNEAQVETARKLLDDM